jgi:hypothetical protein
MQTQVMAKRLIERGFTQVEIAAMIEARGARCTQSTVHRMLRGSDPTFSVGDALRRAYMDVIEAPREQVGSAA